MKRFKVPLVNIALVIYSGEDEWERFKTQTIKKGAAESLKTKCPSGGGRAWGSWLWVYNIHDSNTLYHELSHFIDDTMDDLHSKDTEFRAYITGYVYENVIKWVNSKKNKG